MLPEGSTLRGVNSPFQVDQRGDTKYTYLDTSGRPVVVVSKGNIVFEHNVGFTVDYSFSSISLVKPSFLCKCLLLYWDWYILQADELAQLVYLSHASSGPLAATG